LAIQILAVVLLASTDVAQGTAPWLQSYVDIPSGRIHYWYAGEGEEILLLHGNTASGRWFTELIPPPGFKLVAPDMPGFGLSWRPGVFDIGFYADSMLAFMDKLGIIKARLLLGHSLGGLVAADMASTQPDRFDLLTLSNVPYLGKSRIDGSYFERAGRYATEDYLLRAALKNTAPSLLDEGLLAMMFDEAKLMDPQGFTENPRLLTTTDRLGALSAFKGSILFLGCSLDATIPPGIVRYNSMLTPGSRYLELEGIGHAPMLEAPGLYMETISAFLNGLLW
jgi:branched-chain amino acid transport system permease protein